MNIIPVITLFGGLTAFVTLALTMRLVVGINQANGKPNENQLAGS